jgi:hypothetical protein
MAGQQTQECRCENYQPKWSPEEKDCYERERCHQPGKSISQSPPSDSQNGNGNDRHNSGQPVKDCLDPADVSCRHIEPAQEPEN